MRTSLSNPARLILALLIAATSTRLDASALATLATLATPAAQASSTASLNGHALDPDEAGVMGAAVRLTQIDTGRTRETVTDRAGRFTFPLLPPGTYRLEVTRDGFDGATLEPLTLQVNDELAIRVVLRLRGVAETVDVTGQASLVRDTPAVSTSVPRVLVDRLPLNGRNLQSLLLLTPGVNLNPTVTQGASGQFSINGQRPSGNAFIVDGVSANVGVTGSAVPGEGGSGSLPALTVQGGTSSLVSIEALQEFSVQTSTYSAEFGRTPGGQISVVTRAGTNILGGTLFDYFRDDSLDATDFFVNRGGLPKPPLRQHQFGGALGGPVRLGGLYDGRGRTHFFASHETLRLEQPQAVSATTISMASRMQAPAAIRPLFDAYPVPTGADLGGGLARFEASYSTPSRARASSLRLDHAAGSRVTAFGRYNHAPSSTAERDTATPSVVRHEDRDTDTITIGSTLILTAASLLDVRYNHSTVAASTVRTLDTFGGAVPPPASALLPEAAGGQGYVNVNLGGAAPGFAVGTDALNRQRQDQLVAALTFAFGAHTLKAGTDWRPFRSTFGTDQDSQYRPTYNFSGVAGALSSTLGSGLINVRESARLDFDNLSLYVQDDWRPSARLTLSYGLRYELNPAPHGATDAEHPSAVTTIEPLSAVSLAPPGAPLYATSTRTAGPRAGAVYRLGDRRGWTTTIRGGYGLYFDLGYGAVANAAGAFPLLRTKRLAAGTAFPLNAASAAPLAADAGPPYDLIRALDPELQLPRTHQYSVGVDQQLGGARTLTASYVGAIGQQLLRQESVNAPNASIGILQLTTNRDRSDYDALQLQFVDRTIADLVLQAGYTFSTSTDTSSSAASFLPPSERFDPALDEGPSDFDVRHAVSAALSWNVPAPRNGASWLAMLASGWGIDAIVHARSGQPFSVTGNRQTPVGFLALRPDRVADEPLWIDDGSVPGGRRVNAQAFAFGPEPRHGSMPRNALRGFPFWQMDLAIGRRLTLGGSWRAEIRAEAFNVFNHANFYLRSARTSLGLIGATGAFTTPPDFGVSTDMLRSAYAGLNPLYQVGGPRSVQLSVRLRF
jgi:hypothetical protein